MTTDRIEKSVLVRAPRAKVWRALSDVDAFGEWFDVKRHLELRLARHGAQQT